jgi:hypothetical protein
MFNHFSTLEFHLEQTSDSRVNLILNDFAWESKTSHFKVASESYFTTFVSCVRRKAATASSSHCLL